MLDDSYMYKEMTQRDIEELEEKYFLIEDEDEFNELNDLISFNNSIKEWNAYD